MRAGILQAAAAYVIWGLFPLYFRLLQGVGALEVLGHRIVWSLLFLVGVLGMLQYIGPTLQLALGVWVFGEPFAGGRAQGFMIIWAACLIFSVELLWRHRKERR